ncbi:MAG: hypothetical protein ABI705_05940 [Aestuariivirga sp.]
MEITTRDFLTVLHGMAFAALFMLAFSGALLELYRLSAPGPQLSLTSTDQTLFGVFF